MPGESSIRSFKDLDVWQVAIALAEACYRQTKTFPREEAYGMTSQIRRAASAIPANIAEGYGRESTGAYTQGLRVAQGSLKELETHLMLAERVGLMPAETSSGLLAECDRISKMLRNLIRALQAKA
ncbi:MAG TPA: four helix bundle protein [Hyphomicrobiaceae bacterium]|nr:four helix bundle protein [Hyphomicrobiaceae bacterium]